MAVAQQLGGDDFLPFGRGGSALVTWPGEGGNHWQDLDPAAAAAGVEPLAIEKGIGLGGHLDGYGPSNVDWTGGVMLKATALLEDVSSGQAAFHVWPASHKLFHEYIQMRPEEIDGGFHNSLLEETPHLGVSPRASPRFWSEIARFAKIARSDERLLAVTDLTVSRPGVCVLARPCRAGRSPS